MQIATQDETPLTLAWWKASCAVKVIQVEMHMEEVIKGYFTSIKHREQQLQAQKTDEL